MSNYLNASKTPVFHGELPARILPDFRTHGRTLLDTLILWNRRSRERMALREMDDRLLRDAGISKADAEHEAGKPFWVA